MALPGYGSRLALLHTLLSALLLALAPGDGSCQDPADVLDRANRAYETGDFREAAKLFSYLLNPELVLADSVWVAALHQLTHSLLQVGRSDLAGVWLRWALRHRGRVRLDDVNFPPAVIRAFAEAGRAVHRGLSGDTVTLVATRWRWPERPQELFALGGIVAVSPLSEGEERCRTSALSVELNPLVDLGDLPVGQVRYLPPETYVLARSGPGCPEARIEREVLPGVITEVLEAARLTIVSDTELVVYLDGQVVGTTRRAGVRERGPGLFFEGRELMPVNEFPLTPGTHKVALVSSFGWTVRDTVIMLGAGERVVLNLPATAARHFGPALYVTSEPEAAVYLDGQLIGVAPVGPPGPHEQARVGGRAVPFVWGYRVDVGTYVLSLRRAGYEPFDTVVVFGNQPRVDIMVRLRRRDGEDVDPEYREVSTSPIRR